MAIVAIYKSENCNNFRMDRDCLIGLLVTGLEISKFVVGMNFGAGLALMTKQVF